MKQNGNHQLIERRREDASLNPGTGRVLLACVRCVRACSVDAEGKVRVRTGTTLPEGARRAFAPLSHKCLEIDRPSYGKRDRS